MRRALAISFATILIAAVACDEFSEGVPAADAGDASTNGDGSATDDGGADAIADSGPRVPFCATVDAAFCWSFDDQSAGSALFGPKFGPKDPKNPVTLSTLALSPPYAMLAEGDGASGPWMLRATLPATLNATCTMSVFIEEITNQTELITFAVGSAASAFLVEGLDEDSVKTSLLADRSTDKRVIGLPNIPTKQWQKITLGAERIGSTGLTLHAATEDGTRVDTELIDAGADIFAQPFAVEVGYYVQYGGEGAVRVDDVFCTYE